MDNVQINNHKADKPTVSMFVWGQERGGHSYHLVVIDESGICQVP